MALQKYAVALAVALGALLVTCFAEMLIRSVEMAWQDPDRHSIAGALPGIPIALPIKAYQSLLAVVVGTAVYLVLWRWHRVDVLLAVACAALVLAVGMWADGSRIRPAFYPGALLRLLVVALITHFILRRQLRGETHGQRLTDFAVVLAVSLCAFCSVALVLAAWLASTHEPSVDAPTWLRYIGIVMLLGLFFPIYLAMAYACFRLSSVWLQLVIAGLLGGLFAMLETKTFSPLPAAFAIAVIVHIVQPRIANAPSGSALALSFLTWSLVVQLFFVGSIQFDGKYRGVGRFDMAAIAIVPVAFGLITWWRCLRSDGRAEFYPLAVSGLLAIVASGAFDLAFNADYATRGTPQKLAANLATFATAQFVALALSYLVWRLAVDSGAATQAPPRRGANDGAG